MKELDKLNLKIVLAFDWLTFNLSMTPFDRYATQQATKFENWQDASSC
jgi:hypothetical protein